MEMVTIYMTGMIFLMGMFAWRVPREDCRIVFILGLIWPLTIVLTVFMIFLDAVNWKLEVAKGTKMFGFRKSANPKVRGYAVTIIGDEFQMFKVTK